MPLVKVDASFVLLKAADVSTYTAVVLPAYMPTYLPPYLLHTCLDKYPHAYQTNTHAQTFNQNPWCPEMVGGVSKHIMMIDATSLVKVDASFVGRS